ncbi:uncharacterized protein BO95DRAFT_248085 [Aspergillus brunneoviolaceus CBS 621.78]|uniref:Uncharacterized protein n=1 Tax=Aspergillus brunneoviolaceus CBS 621.78 TaxID=1450534 RepID=A0ACD1GKK8_9EURO|nr:hypothetical protein BO95DRAFT_248085 [Aspergillus brunneoviolaceus CBS 621.78]RAH49860.1 hypothetical protein BO95DRAFT_248085 [Aspergillus brunneoviolaceus CBS 621.78]
MCSQFLLQVQIPLSRLLWGYFFLRFLLFLFTPHPGRAHLHCSCQPADLTCRQPPPKKQKSFAGMLNITCNVCAPCCLELFFFLTQFFPADTSATLLHGDKTSIRLFSFHRQEKLGKASAFLPFFMIVCYMLQLLAPLSPQLAGHEEARFHARCETKRSKISGDLQPLEVAASSRLHLYNWTEKMNHCRLPCDCHERSARLRYQTVKLVCCFQTLASRSVRVMG